MQTKMKNGTTNSFENKNFDNLPKKQAKSYEIDLGQNVILAIK